MTDLQILRLMSEIDRLMERVALIVSEIEDSNHPNNHEITDALSLLNFPNSYSAQAIVYPYLTHPENFQLANGIIFERVTEHGKA